MSRRLRSGPSALAVLTVQGLPRLSEPAAHVNPLLTSPHVRSGRIGPENAKSLRHIAKRAGNRPRSNTQLPAQGAVLRRPKHHIDNRREQSSSALKRIHQGLINTFHKATFHNITKHLCGGEEKFLLPIPTQQPQNLLEKICSPISNRTTNRTTNFTRIKLRQ